MSWEENLQNEVELEAHFVRAVCRLRVLSTEFTLLSGNVYYASFTHGPVMAAIKSATTLTYEDASADLTALGADKFYYDRDTKRLYINFGGAPSSSSYIVASFYLFFATEECIWFETPDDDTTPLVNWLPLVKEPPAYRVTITPTALGYFPIEPTVLSVYNDHSLNYLLSKGSFRRTAVETWHQLGDRATDDTSVFEKSLTAIFGMRIQADDDSIMFDVVDKSYQFDKIFDGAYFTADLTDPRFLNAPMLRLIGSGSGPSVGLDSFFEMVNLDYNADAPTTSNNRKFALYYDPNGEYTEVQIPGTGINAVFTPSNHNHDHKLRSGQRVWMDGASDKYLIFDSATDTNFLFTTSPFSGTPTAYTLRRSTFEEVVLVKDGTTPYTLVYGRDFTETLHDGNAMGITLTSSAEANVGAATYDPSVDSIWCIPLGSNKQLTFDGDVIGETSPSPYKKGIYVLYQFLKHEVGMDESEINWDSIAAVEDLCDYQVMLPAPLLQETDYQEFRAYLDLLLKSLLLRGYYDKDGRFSVKAFGPVGDTAGDVQKEDITGFSFTIDYSEMKKIKFLWAWAAGRRLVYSGTKADWLANIAPMKIVDNTETYLLGNALTSGEGTFIHEVENAETFEHLVSSNDETFMDRVRALFGERLCTLNVTGKRLALDKDPGDDLTVYRDSLPGFDDAEGNNANFNILEIDKSKDQVRLTLSDNKAPNDAGDDW